MSVYYNPEELGLKQIAQVDYSDGDYQFDYRVVWQQTKTGKLYTARDAGCSCPAPFEDYPDLASLDLLRSLRPLRSEIAEEQKSSYYAGADHQTTQDFLRTVERALKK